MQSLLSIKNCIISNAIDIINNKYDTNKIALMFCICSLGNGFEYSYAKPAT